MTKLLLTLSLILTACGASNGLETYTQDEPADVGTLDSGTPGTVDYADIDAGTGPAWHIGDPCYCCVWAPGSSYPNGDVYCMQGEVEMLAGLMCHAYANDSAPSWAPDSKGCTLDNPWGKPE